MDANPELEIDDVTNDGNYYYDNEFDQTESKGGDNWQAIWRFYIVSDSKSEKSETEY